MAEIEERYQHQLQSLVKQLDRTTQELDHTKEDLERHKDTLSTTESLLHSQIDQLSERLSVRDQEVATFAHESQELRQEVLSKTQQVKQYKKQVDQYKEQVGAFTHQTEVQIKQVCYRAVVHVLIKVYSSMPYVGMALVYQAQTISHPPAYIQVIPSYFTACLISNPKTARVLVLHTEGRGVATVLK